MNDVLFRLARLFASTDRPIDRHILMEARNHYQNYGKLGDHYERSLRDIESRNVLSLQKFDNFISDMVEHEVLKRVPEKKTKKGAE